MHENQFFLTLSYINWFKPKEPDVTYMYFSHNKKKCIPYYVEGIYIFFLWGKLITSGTFGSNK